MDNRYLRQKDIVKTDKLAEQNITVVGCGAIGRDVAIKLTNIGVQNLTIIDFDTVEDVNLSPQGFMEVDIGRSKVDATKDLLLKINSSINIKTINKKFMNNMFTRGVIFCCVDSMTVRKNIFNSTNSELFIDGRMAAENLQVYSAFDPESRKFYSTTLFDQSQAYTGSCTGRSTNYCASIASGIMISEMTKWLRGIEPDHMVDFNLLSMELTSKQGMIK